MEMALVAFTESHQGGLKDIEREIRVTKDTLGVMKAMRDRMGSFAYAPPTQIGQNATFVGVPIVLVEER
jgi:hypothetical protein